MIELDLNYVIRERDGAKAFNRVPMRDDNGNQQVDNGGNLLFKNDGHFRIRNVIEEVCVNPIPEIDERSGNYKQVPKEDKKRLWRIWNRLQQSKSTLKLYDEDISLIKLYANRRWNSPLTLGQIERLIEPGGEWDLTEEEEKKKQIPSGKRS